MKLLPAFFGVLALAKPISRQGNGELQLHFIDGGQHDGALLISPNGQVAALGFGHRVYQQHHQEQS